MYEKIHTVIIFVRALKMMTLMYEIKSLRIIIETLKNLLEPISLMMATLLIVYYFFALAGMQIFGGKITKDLPYPLTQGTNTVPATYHLDNFNDFISSLITLFTLMVVNNWMFQVSQFIVVMEGEINENLVRLFFIIFYQFSVVIGINLVVAFVLDMYDSTERMDNERLKTLVLLKEEMMTGTKKEKDKQIIEGKARAFS